MKLAANQIDESAVGKTLVDYSHIGEDPFKRELPDRIDSNDPPLITEVRLSDSDNVVVVVCGTIEFGIGEKGWIEVSD